MATVLDVTNVALAAAPPEFFVPNQNGVAVPAGFTKYSVVIDVTGLPDGQQLADLTVEYRRGAWTDSAGIAHPANEWLPDFGANLTIGPDRHGGRNDGWNSSIGAVDGQGNMVEPYPDRVRFRIKSSPGWTLPRVTITMS